MCNGSVQGECARGVCKGSVKRECERVCKRSARGYMMTTVYAPPQNVWFSSLWGMYLGAYPWRMNPIMALK